MRFRNEKVRRATVLRRRGAPAATARRLRQKVAVVAISTLSLATGLASANPEFLVPAMEFGARDCGYCHLTPQGGEAHNERGAWLVAERERRGADAIDVSWLAAREANAEAAAGESLAQQDQAESQVQDLAAEQAQRKPLPSLPPLPKDRQRAFDYSTAHGDWPAYGGDLGARKYSPLAQITVANATDLRVAWVWEAFDNQRYVGGRGARRRTDSRRHR